MKKPARVLVLDAGGPGSVAVMGLVRQAALPIQLIAADMNPDCLGREIADEFVVVPSAGDSAFTQAIQDIVRDYKIDLIMPSFHFGYQKLLALDEALFTPKLSLALLCQDKWNFYVWLTDNGYLTPSTVLLADVKSVSSGVYVKPRRGAGAKDNHILESQNDLVAFRQNCEGSEYIVQDVVRGQHWTVEVLRHDGVLVSCSPMKVTEHVHGNARAVQLEHNREIEDICGSVLQDLGYEGPANFDFMQTERGYELLEINPRFGSTIAFVGMAGRNVPAFLLTSDDLWLGKQRLARYEHEK